MRSQAVEAAARRIRVLRVCFIAVFLILAGRATMLSLVETRAEQLSDAQSLTSLRLASKRGGIFDRSHQALAVEVLAPSVYVSPTELEDPVRTVRALARALDVDRRHVAERLAGRARFTYLARWVSDEQARRVEALGLPGVGIVREPRRVFPGGSLAGRTVGFSNVDGLGVRGIEQQEDEWLRGQKLRMSVQRDAKGRLMATEAFNSEETAGGDIALSIDLAMQAEAETALREAVERSNAAGGVVVSLDPRTGEILALAEEPSFDPNSFRTIPYAETRSRAFLDAVEPGSTFKAFLVAAALEAGVVNERTQFDCTGGTYRVRGKTVRDHKDYGVIDLEKLLTVSSNCGAVQVAERLGPELHHEALRRFGFGSRTGSGFPFESAGLLRAWEEWKPVDAATVAYGQGVSVTPVQLASALGALANGGVLLPPHLVIGRRAPRQQWERVEPPRGRQILTPGTADAVLRLMGGVVGEEGTGRRAGLRDVAVAGKTGTAQKYNAETGRYSKTEYVAWFMGVVPAEDPRLVIVAAIDEPKGITHGGGDFAAPLFARVAANQLAHLGMVTSPQPIPAKIDPAKVAQRKKQQEQQAAQIAARRSRNQTSKSRPAATPPPSVAAAPPAAVPQAPAPPKLSPAPNARNPWNSDRVLVPEFRGSTMAEVKQLAAKYIIEVELHGSGLAIAQDPAPGTVLSGTRRRVRIRFAMGES